VYLYSICSETRLNMAVQYSSGTMLLTVQLVALKAMSVTELLAATDLTLTNDTECKELNC